jgi:peptidoglycan-associated lipoprotein
MRFQIVTLFAAAVLLAACGSSSDETMTTTGGGTSGTTGVTTGSTTSEALPGPVEGSQEHLVVEVGDRVFFAFDRSDLSAEAQATVEALAAWLKLFPAVTLTLEGNCDERGTREYNLALGERRANAVRDYLIALGIDPNRLTTISYGKERPTVLGSNEAAWAQNRNTIFVVN